MKQELLSKQAADELIHWIRAYAASNIDSYLADSQGCFPPHIFLDMGTQGFFGMHISRKYGGLELDTYDMLRVLEQIAAIDLSLCAVFIEVIQGSHTLENYATETMKDLYLEKLAKGRIFTAGAMTESAAGSNPRAMKSLALATARNSWILKGTKRWVGLGNCAELIAVYVNQMDANDNWLGMSGFLVPRGTKGLEIGPNAPTMGLRGFAKNTIFLDEIEVFAENLLGKAGRGMEIAQNNMMYIRLCLGAASVGAMKRCVQLMERYAQRRQIATGPLIENPLTLVQFSETITMIDAIDNFIYQIASFYDSDPNWVPEEAFVVAKILGSEYLGQTTDALVQLLGARGYEEASGASQLFRDARVFRIFEGPTEALNMYVGSRVLGQNSELEQFIVNLLGQKKLFDEIKHNIDSIRQLCESQRLNLFEKPFALDYWVQFLAGEILGYGLLLAVTHYTFSLNPSKKLTNAALWIRDKYDEALKKASKMSIGESLLMQATELAERTGQYSRTIGNVEQTRSLQSLTIDNLLKAGEKRGRQEHRCDQEFSLKKKETTQEVASEEESLRLLKHWNDKQISPKLFVHQLFEQQAAMEPDAIAIIYNEKTITYRELNRLANRLAHFLGQEGVGPDTIVGIYIERSLEMIVGLLAILKVGAAYLPLDYGYPKKTLQFMFEDSGSKFLLSQKSLEKNIPFKAQSLIFVDEITENSSLNLADTNFEENLDLESLGYVIYTSGSTGKPKGVMLPHRALANLIEWQRKTIAGKRNVLQFTALSFDMSFLEIFSALSSGGSLSLISEKERIDPWHLAHLVKQNRVEQLVLSVPFFKQLAEFNLAPYFLHLKEIIIAGEQLIINPAIRSFFSQLSGCKLLNYYGPSETHVVTAYQFPENINDWPTYPPIGKPIANAKVLLLNNNKELVPVGKVGEIYLSGLCLAKGYLNRKDLNEEKFIPDPWSKDPSDRLYRSGDLAKYLTDGNLIFLGRKDEQIKIRGFRIEPKEIEAHLIKHPRVKEAVVVAKEGISAEKHLEAFIMIEGDECNKLINHIYAFLQENLPPHMVPSVFNIVEAMPLTDSGKIDRQALIKQKRSITHSVNKLVEASTPTEKEVIAIMEDIFKLQIGLNNSFSSIGGNSLLAMQIVSKLRDKFSVELPACTILSDPSIADTAKRIDSLLQHKN